MNFLNLFVLSLAYSRKTEDEESCDVNKQKSFFFGLFNKGKTQNESKVVSESNTCRNSSHDNLLKSASQENQVELKTDEEPLDAFEKNSELIDNLVDSNTYTNSSSLWGFEKKSNCGGTDTTPAGTPAGAASPTVGAEQTTTENLDAKAADTPDATKSSLWGFEKKSNCGGTDTTPAAGKPAVGTGAPDATKSSLHNTSESRSYCGGTDTTPAAGTPAVGTGAADATKSSLWGFDNKSNCGGTDPNPAGPPTSSNPAGAPSPSSNEDKNQALLSAERESR